jgi:hypothetical protein
MDETANRDNPRFGLRCGRQDPLEGLGRRVPKMDRRRFLEIAGASSTWLATGWRSVLNLVRPAIPRAIPIVSRTPAEKPPQVGLHELLAQGTLPLGKLHSRQLHVFVDDIAADSFLQHLRRDTNVLVISSYIGGTSSLRSAVEARLRELSPADYEEVNRQLTNESALKKGEVVSFRLNLQSTARKRFPIDALIAVIFEPSIHDDNFSWTPSALEAAERMNASNLILPCLGREWRDRHSIKFQDFFESVLTRFPNDGKSQGSVHFSLYSQWPTFELDAAVAALNNALRTAGTAKRRE